ncbi:lysophospholipase [Crocinitomicaceae bacterium]|nr:lysophospholipase [Crocinitomicaceae bacterium]MDB4606775.1 lysophospholipase [Crocinitomicaceae bacterium]
MKQFKKVRTEDDLEIQLYKSNVITPKAILFLVHGMGEHAMRYAHVAEYFKNVNILSVAIDLRGHGRSQGKRGHMPTYDLMMSDLKNTIGALKEEFSGIPFFIYGHSMGGNLVLNYLIRNKETVTAAIASGPYLRLGFEPPKWKVFLARISANIYPGLSQPTELEQEALSRTPQVLKEYKNDPLVHDKITASFFVNIHQAGIDAIERAAEITTPLLLMHGAKDRLTSPAGTKDFHSNAMSHVKLHMWDELYHEIHNEPEKTQVFKMALKWFQQFLDK